MRCLIFFLRDTNFHSETAVIKMSKKKKKAPMSLNTFLMQQLGFHNRCFCSKTGSMLLCMALP